MFIQSKQMIIASYCNIIVWIHRNDMFLAIYRISYQVLLFIDVFAWKPINNPELVDIQGQRNIARNRNSCFTG